MTKKRIKLQNRTPARRTQMHGLHYVFPYKASWVIAARPFRLHNYVVVDPQHLYAIRYILWIYSIQGPGRLLGLCGLWKGCFRLSTNHRFELCLLLTILSVLLNPLFSSKSSVVQKVAQVDLFEFSRQESAVILSQFGKTNLLLYIFSIFRKSEGAPRHEFSVITAYLVTFTTVTIFITIVCMVITAKSAGFFSLFLPRRGIELLEHKTYIPNYLDKHTNGQTTP